MAAAADEGEGPLFRRNLIRAALPRPVGEVPVRQIPTFTIREAAARPNKFRYKQRPGGAPGGGTRQGRPNGTVNGNQTRAGRNPQGRPGGGKQANHAGNAFHTGNHASGAKNRQGHGGGNKRFK